MDLKTARLLASMMVGRNQEVEYGNFPTASTNGRRTRIPICTGEDAPVLIRGYLDHEDGHGKHTDFRVQPGNGVTGALVQVLEDVRQERLESLALPGVKSNLARLVGMIKDKADSGLFHAKQPDADPDELLVAYVLQRLRCNILGQETIAENADATEAAIREAFPPGVVARLDALMFQVTGCPDTAAVKRLARRIHKDLAEALEALSRPIPSDGDGDQGPPDNRDPQVASGDGPADGEDQHQGAGAASCRDGGDQGPGDSGGVSRDSADGGADASGGQGDGAGGGPQDGVSDPDRGSGDEAADNGAGDGDGRADAPTPGQIEALRRAIESTSDIKADIGDLIGEEIANLASKDRDQTWSIGSVGEAQPAPSGGGGSGPGAGSGGGPLLPDVYDLDAARRESSALRVKLARMLEARDRHGVYHERTGRKIGTKVLHRVGIGDRRIFERRSSQTAVNTAVYVLVDRSGSMSNRMGTAMQATYATTLAVEGVRGACVASGAFPAPDAGLLPLTQFGERVETTRHRYGITAYGGTPMAPAIGAAAMMLVARQEPRKMLFVATDGAPDNPYAVEHMVDDMRRWGIEVIGMGINTMSVTTLFPVHRVINDVSELSRAMLELVRERMLAWRRNAA